MKITSYALTPADKSVIFAWLMDSAFKNNPPTARAHIGHPDSHLHYYDGVLSFFPYDPATHWNMAGKKRTGVHMAREILQCYPDIPDAVLSMFFSIEEFLQAEDYLND